MIGEMNINMEKVMNNLTEEEEKEIRELVAEVSHEIWSHWMKYLFSRCEDDDLGIVIMHEDARHWDRQRKMPYEELTEREKDSDREQADKIIKIINKYLGWK